MGWTIRTVLSWSKQYLKDKGIDNPRLDAELLLSSSLGLKRIDLYMDMDRPLMESELAVYRGFLQRRAKKEPVAYILGEKEFYSRSFLVTPQVLIPRPETEILVDEAIKRAPAGAHILEVGVGSGAVIISVLAERGDLTGVASDISAGAAGVARENAARHHVKDRVAFFVGRGFSALRSSFPLIIMNPPYIASDEKEDLAEDVLLYEPHGALFGGNDGLDIIKEILLDVRNYLTPGGVFIMETGCCQKTAVEDLVSSDPGLRIISWIRDLSGIDRVSVMERRDG